MVAILSTTFGNRRLFLSVESIARLIPTGREVQADRLSEKAFVEEKRRKNVLS